MKVSYHPFKEVRLDKELRADEDLAETEGEGAQEIRKNKYSFVAMTYHPARRVIIVGATNMAGDILLTFDPGTRTFASLDFAGSIHWSESANKIHKGLTLDRENDEVYFGVATLQNLPNVIGRPGGALLKYNFSTETYTKTGDSGPGQFNQATLVDLERQLMYTATLRSCFGVYDLDRGNMKAFEPVGSIPHNLAADDRGGVWGTHSPGSHAFFRYDPDREEFEFPENCAFPNAPDAADIMYPGAGPVDSIINGGDGYLYTASALGEIYRIDPEQGKLRYLGKPFPGIRLPAMAIGNDGWIYMAGGRDTASHLARYHTEDKRFELLGPVETPDGRFLNYAHELCIVDGVCYIGETDNRIRSGYMWACEI